jgi:hypothetical protein
MRALLFIVLTVAGMATVKAQQLVVDPEHLAVVIQNGMIRSGAESTHDQYLKKINDNIDNLSANMDAVIVAQTMIYQGLSNVNSALKNGMAVRNLSVIVADMYRYIDQALVLAKDQPYLLLFAGNIAGEMRNRATALVTDVSSVILKDGGNMLADFNARDQLIRKVTQQLQILNGLAYGAWKSIFWAKQRGIIATATPFAAYIGQDKMFVDRIIQQAKYLKP